MGMRNTGMTIMRLFAGCGFFIYMSAKRRRFGPDGACAMQAA
jgi:hypothetical protein